MFLSYVLSFVYVGIYWNNHHHMLHAVKHVSGAGAVEQPAPAVLAVADAVHHRRGWARTISRRSRWRSTASGLLMNAIAYTILVRALIAAHGRDSEFAARIGGDIEGQHFARDLHRWRSRCRS